MRRQFILAVIALIAWTLAATPQAAAQPASDDWSNLREAVREADTSRIRKLVRRGVDINERWLSYSVLHNYTNYSIYQYPRKLKKKHFAIPALMKSYGFNYKAEHNGTMLASNITKKEDDMPFLRALVEAGAVVDGNAIAKAASYNRSALVEYLRQHQVTTPGQTSP